MKSVQAQFDNSLIKVSAVPPMEHALIYGVMWLLTATVLFPHMAIGNVDVGLDDACAAFLFVIFIGYLLLKPKNFLFRRDGLLVTGLWTFIIFTGIIFSVIGGLYNLDQFRMPTEMWQYVKRMLFFYFACYISYMTIITPRKFNRCIQIVLLIAFVIGVLQILPGSVGGYLANLYARSEGQLAGTEKSFAVLRNYGVAGFATSWGGFAVLGVAVSFGSLLIHKKNTDINRFSRFQWWIILVLAVINVMFSGSRVAITALIGVYIVFVMLGVIYLHDKISFLIKYIGIFSLICAGVIYTLWEKILFIYFRFSNLIDQAGGSRIDQVESALSLLTNIQSWLFGVGNVTQRKLASSFGTEVEPVYLLVNYGILGVLLRYGLLLVIFIYAWRQLKRAAQHDRNLALATILALVGYTVFSLGYFFYQELYVGLLPWLLFGWVVGAYYREKRLRTISISRKQF